MAPRSSLSVTSLASLDDTPSGSLRLGFVGCGTIARAIATGLATHPVVQHMAVSRRSAAKSAALAQEFPHLVSVHDDNQDVVDAADLLFLTVLPQQVESVLQDLRLDPQRHVLVSLVSTSTLPALIQASGLPASSVFRMICLPAVADREGVCLLTPPVASREAVLYALLDSLGGVVQATSEAQMSAMMVPSGLMGSFYGLLRNNRDYLVRHGGLDEQSATFLVGRLYHSMVRDVLGNGAKEKEPPKTLDALIEEQTPGGLNEQGLDNLTQLGVWEAYDQVQGAIHDRILGKSDGRLPSSSDQSS